MNLYHYDGAAYVPSLDQVRLSRQSDKIFRLMRCGGWFTLAEISVVTGAPEASASAVLRDFRKPRWGCFRVEKRRRGEEKRGLWEYRMLPPLPAPVQQDLWRPE